MEVEQEFNAEVGLIPKEGDEGRAFLVGTFSYPEERELALEYLKELESLADTFGIPVVGQILSPLRGIDPATYLSSGKLEEIRKEMGLKGANLLIVDQEISPAQQRNLERILRSAVMDRTELILEIFGQRAETKEAQLQIELAKVKYQFPRLKRLWSHFSRQRARGGYLKGEGEKQLEIDKRLLKRRVDRLQQELKEIQRTRKTQKQARMRSAIPTFAIIGYTNAGKSTLLNALTEAEVLVEDKLFATLDPTTRKFTLPNRQEILLTDTVGFIRKLPTTLVAAFRSTLEAALHDDILIHLIDASHPLAAAHAETTYAILKQLGADTSSIITVLNKTDLAPNRDQINKLRLTYPKTVLISALKREGFEELMECMIEQLRKRREEIHVRIPQSEYGLVSLLKREGHVSEEEYEGNEILLRAEVPLTLLHRFQPYRIQ